MHNFDNLLNTDNEPLKELKKPVKSRFKKIRNTALIIGGLGYLGASVIYFTIFLISLMLGNG